MYSLIYIIAIISIIVYLSLSWYDSKLVYVRAKLDNKLYVVRNLENKQEAAELLAKVDRRLTLLLNKLIKKYKKTDERVTLLKKRFKNHEIREALHKNNQTSYSINKGEQIVLCVRNKKNPLILTDVNTITFVAIHEMSHIMTTSIGHKPEFWENMRFLLAHAIKWKLYKEINYKDSPKPYCGIKITETPLQIGGFDEYFKKND